MDVDTSYLVPVQCASEASARLQIRHFSAHISSSLTNGFHSRTMLQMKADEVELVLRHNWHCPLAQQPARQHRTSSLLPTMVPRGAKEAPDRIHSSTLLWLRPPSTGSYITAFYSATAPQFLPLPDQLIHSGPQPTSERSAQLSPLFENAWKVDEVPSSSAAPPLDRAGQTNGGLLWGRRDRTQPTWPVPIQHSSIPFLFLTYSWDRTQPTWWSSTLLFLSYS